MSMLNFSRWLRIWRSSLKWQQQKELEMTRFTNFGSRGAPRADLHRSPTSTMGHESLIQRRPSLSHPGWLKYFFQTYNQSLQITIHLVLMFVEILKLMLNRDSEIEVWSRFVWNLWHERIPRVRFALGNVLPIAIFIWIFLETEMNLTLMWKSLAPSIKIAQLSSIGNISMVELELFQVWKQPFWRNTFTILEKYFYYFVNHF